MNNTPPNNDELERAIKEANWKLQYCVDYTDGTLVMEFRQVQELTKAAERCQQVDKENAALKSKVEELEKQDILLERSLKQSNDAAEKLEHQLSQYKSALEMCERVISKDIPKCRVCNPPHTVYIDSMVWNLWIEARNEALSLVQQVLREKP